MRPALCLESSLPCQAGLASGPTSLPRTQQSRSVGAAVTTPAHPPTALGGRESGYPISQTKKRRLRKVAGVLGPGDPVAKPETLPRQALARSSSIGPSAPAAVSGPWGEGRPPPRWEHRSWRSEVLRKWPLRSSEPSERGRVPPGQERRHPSQVR